jgi:hypothetical protein
MNLEDININRNFFTFDSMESWFQDIGGGNKNLNVLCVNLRSIRKNWDLLVAHLGDMLPSIHILVLLEINISEVEIINYSLPGYESFSQCRPTGRGGGVLLFYKNYLKIENLPVQFLTAELMMFKLDLKNTNTFILVFYRPPSSNVNHFNSELETLLSSDLLNNNENIIMVGDLNICYLSETYGAMDYVNVLHSYGLHYTITEPTRIEFMNNNLVSSCIDHLNARLHNIQYKSFTIEIKVADHYFIGVSLSDENIARNIYKETAHIEIISDRLVSQGIEQSNWWPILDITDPEEIYNAIFNTFTKIYTHSIIRIKQKKSSHTCNPWMNSQIRAMIKEKNRLWKQIKRNRYDTQLKSEFKNLRNQLNNIIRRTKRMYYFNLFNSHLNDIRKSWSIVNSVLNKNKRNSVAETIRKNFNIRNQEQLQDVCNKFKNTFHHKLATTQTRKFELINEMIPSPYTTGNDKSLYINKINEDLLSLVIKKLNRNSSPGPDKIRPKDIIDNYIYLKLVLIHFINRSIDTGKIPQALKLTHIRPIYKKGDKTETNNYRPIGSISAIMKILEHYVNYHINKFCYTFSIINDSQYGFIQGRSTTDLIDRLTNDINVALNSRRYIVAISLDLTKAFDMIQYTNLLEKLSRIGIGGKLLKWIENYFSNRIMKISIDDICSSSIEQTCGLIQGSVLAPTFFNIYVNDLGYIKFKGKLLQYADDTIIYSEHVKLSQAIIHTQLNLNLAVKYFSNNKININPSKTQVIVFKINRMAQNTQQDSIIFHNQTCLATENSNCHNCNKIDFINCIKHLGIYLDSNMKYNSHITHICKVLRIALYKFYKLTQSFPIHIKRILYFSLVESIIRYGLNAYSTAPEYILKPLKNILNRIYKSLFHNIPPELLGILKFDNLRSYTTLEKYYFQSRFRQQRETRYSTRTESYVVPRYNNEYGKNTLEYRIPTLLNSLPQELKELRSPSLMKMKLKTHLLTNNNNIH